MATGHDNHGSTPAAWTTVGLMLLGMVVGALAVVTLDWRLGALAVVLVIAGAIAGKVMAALGMGRPPSYVDAGAEDEAAGRRKPGRPDPGA